MWGDLPQLSLQGAGRRLPASLGRPGVSKDLPQPPAGEGEAMTPTPPPVRPPPCLLPSQGFSAPLDSDTISPVYLFKTIHTMLSLCGALL